MSPPPVGRATDYGIDAPGVRLAMAGAGLCGMLIGGTALAVALRTAGLATRLAAAVTAIGAMVGVYGFAMAAYMTYASRIGKRRTRDRLLDVVATLLPWTGREHVLDVGCGRGLLLLGAARRLTSGNAVGIDIWRAQDQTGNSREAVLDNAHREGVAGRVQVETGDARALAFPDASFDVVLSHWVVHNLPEKSDRESAIEEMIRVLRPGGVLALADIAHLRDYHDQLAARGFANIQIQAGGLGTTLIGALSGGSFRPQSLIARRV